MTTGRYRRDSNKFVYRGGTKRHANGRRRFRFSAISYYVLSFSAGVALFFIVWEIQQDGINDTPWIDAGIVASIFVIVAVVLRETLIHKSRKRKAARRRLEKRFDRMPESIGRGKKRKKLTLRQNESLLDRISEKSDAARVLDRLAEGHREVFEICNEYLNVTAKELPMTDVHSPRYPAMHKGRRRVKKLHKYHLLRWSEIEAKELSRSARSKHEVAAKIETARQAIDVVESALRFYPEESRLVDSAAALREYHSNVLLSAAISEAERSENEGDLSGAEIRYRRLLEKLPEEHMDPGQRTILEEKIRRKLDDLAGGPEKDR